MTSRPTPARDPSLARTLARSVSALAVLSLAAPGAAGAQAFPHSSLQPSGYDGARSTYGSPPVQLGAPVGGPSAGYDGGYGPPSGERVRVDMGGPSAPSRVLALPRGKSAMIELPTDAKDVVVSDPKTADVVLSTPRRIFVMGMGAGQTDAAFYDAGGRLLMKLDIRVDQDVSGVGQTMSRLLPGSHIRADAVNSNIILSGEAANTAEADKALRIAASYVAKPEQVLNMMSVAASEQVMLKVKFVEVNRTVIKQLGFNTQAVLNRLGDTQFLLGFSPTYAINGALLGGIAAGLSKNSTYQGAPSTTNTVTATSGFTTGTIVDPVTGLQQVVGGNGGIGQTYINPNNTLTATATSNGLSTSQSAITGGHAGSSGLNSGSSLIQAFERVGLVRTLAEPNLTAVSGESAKFLAGGEFPVPVAQDNLGRITVEFKPFGVGLGFTPIVLSNGLISLKLSTEVSEVSNLTSFASAAGGSTLVIPGLNVRRTETTVELPSGGAMMISGLLQSKLAQNLDSLPGLMQVPILGSLFRSRDFLNNETELVVIITPYLVKPVRPDQLQTPADGLQIADDLSTNLLGKLNKGFGKPASAVAAGRTYQGPYGYVVE